MTWTASGPSRVRALALPTAPAAVPAARALLRDVLEGTDVAGRLEDAELALSELTTNAVIHGRDPLSVSVAVDARGVRVEVSDASPVSPSFSMLDSTAVTGRGLLLISAVADRWGVEPSPSGKVVWFELLAGRDAQTALEALDVDALLASWADELVQDPADDCVRVVLTDLDVEDAARSEAHVEALLRELTLLLAAGTARAEDLRAAGDVLSAAAALDPLRADLRHQVSIARARSTATVDLTVTVRRGDAEAVRDLMHALDGADRLIRTGRLLTAPAPVDLSHVRHAYLRRVLAQLGS